MLLCAFIVLVVKDYLMKGTETLAWVAGKTLEYIIGMESTSRFSTPPIPSDEVNTTFLSWHLFLTLDMVQRDISKNQRYRKFKLYHVINTLLPYFHKA